VVSDGDGDDDEGRDVHGDDGDDLLMVMVPMGIAVDVIDEVGVAPMAMLGMVWLAARKFKQRLNVVIVGVESFQGV
jgi:hypothetical protein